MGDKYKVASNIKFYDFLVQIRKLVDEGYAPQGGICVVMEKLNQDGEPDPKGVDTTVYYQAFWK